MNTAATLAVRGLRGWSGVQREGCGRSAGASSIGASERTSEGKAGRGARRLAPGRQRPSAGEREREMNKGWGRGR